MTIEELEARWEALDECLQHLDQEWTDNTVERQQGKWVQSFLLKKQHEIQAQINLKKP